MPSAVCLGCGVRVDDGAPCGCATGGANPYRDAAPSSRAALGGCPRCAVPLAQIDYAETPLDECGSCGGVFVDGWILDRLVAAREARLSLAISLPIRTLHREREVRYLRCPRCSAQMNRKIFGRSSGVVVDVCKSDGIWFDSGELASVLDFIEGGGLERAQRREIEEQNEELRKQKVQRAVEANTPRFAHEPVTLGNRSELAAEMLTALIEWWRF